MSEYNPCADCKPRQGWLVLSGRDDVPEPCKSCRVTRLYEEAQKKACEIFTPEYLLSQLRECPEDKSHIECCIMNMLIGYGCSEELVDEMMEWFAAEHPYQDDEEESCPRCGATPPAVALGLCSVCGHHDEE